MYIYTRCATYDEQWPTSTSSKRRWGKFASVVPAAIHVPVLPNICWVAKRPMALCSNSC